jgi:hypothetical protein
MQRRLSFDNYLGTVLFALLCTCFLCVGVILLGPQIDACFCAVRPVGSASNDVYLIYSLELCPLLTLVFLGIVGCIVYLYVDLFLLR